MKLPNTKINIRIKKGLDFPFNKHALRKVIVEALRSARVNKHIEIDCLITDNRSIQKLNRRYRGIDSPTDVLSFRFAETNLNYDHIDFPEDVEVSTPIGEIIISYSRILEQAAQYGNTVKEEMDLLLIHGTLHLLGYDHISKTDARKMREMENKIKKKLDASGEYRLETAL